MFGPFFIEENLNTERYEQLFSLHNDVNVKRFLEQIFSETWIGKRCTIEWAPRSSDLTPLDYFLPGYLKDSKNRYIKT